MRFIFMFEMQPIFEQSSKLRFSENKTKKFIFFLSSVSNFALFTSTKIQLFLE